MATIMDTLFGVSAERFQQERDAAADAQALAFARLSPIEKASYGVQRGAYGLAGALGSALGGQDPELQRRTQAQQILGMIDPSKPETFDMAAQLAADRGDQQLAFGLRLEGDKYKQEAAMNKALVGQRSAAEKSSLAQAAKTELSVKQEEDLRAELSKLPPEATDDEVLSIVKRFGPPEKILASLSASVSKREAIQAKTESDQLANQARIDAAKVAADAKVEAARLAGATAREIAQMRVDSAKELRLLATSLKGPKVLAPSLQKEEDKELELVDSLTARESSLAPAIASLTVDPKTGKPPLELGPVNNLRYQAQNAAGNSSIESRNYASLQRAVQEATNLKTDAAKGVQTDKDVLRFANELIAAFGGNDTKTTLEALSNFSKSTAKARENAQKRIDSRRKAQGVDPYYGPASGTAQNPIKLD